MIPSMTEDSPLPQPALAPPAPGELLALAARVIRGLRAAIGEENGLLQQASVAEVTQALGALCVGLVRLKEAPRGEAAAAELEELRATLQEAHRELGRLEERGRVETELREQLRRARADSARLKAEGRGHLTRTLELERTRAQLAEARGELEAQRGELERLRARIEERAAEAGSREEAVKQLNALRLAHDEQGARLRCAEFLNAELRQELESVREERDRLLKRTSDEEGSSGVDAGLLAERTRLEAERDQLRADLRVLEESRSAQGRRLTLYQQRIQDQELQLSELTAELRALHQGTPLEELPEALRHTDALSRAQLRAVLENPIHRPALRAEPEGADPDAPDAPLREALPSLAQDEDAAG